MKEKLKSLQALCEKKGVFFSYKNKDVGDAFESMAPALNRGKKILGGAYLRDESKYEKWRGIPKENYFSLVVVPVDCIAPTESAYENIRKVILEAAKEVGIKRAEMGASIIWPAVTIFKDA